MPRTNAVPGRAQIAGREQMLNSIGRRLRDEYGVVLPLPDRLVALLGRIEESGSANDSERADEATSSKR